MLRIVAVNGFLKLAKTRKTTYEFSRRRVREKDIKKILEAGRWAPSCSNSQPWRFIIIKKKEAIEGLMRNASYGGFHTDPPLIIALVLPKECKTTEHVCLREAVSGENESYICIGMCALQMVLEAHDLSISTCILSPTIKVSKLMRVPKSDVVVLMLGFGYEEEGAFQKKRERKEISELVSYGEFGRNK